MISIKSCVEITNFHESKQIITVKVLFPLPMLEVPYLLHEDPMALFALTTSHKLNVKKSI